MISALIAMVTSGIAQDVKPLSYQSIGYPELARQARIAGTVTLSFIVDAAGTPTSIEVITGHPILSAAAKANLSSWLFPSNVSGGSTPPKQITYIFDLSNAMDDGFYNPANDVFVFDGPATVQVRSAPRGTLTANDCPAQQPSIVLEPILLTDSITLSRSGCYGTCPSYQVTLFGDGRVHWQGHGFVEILGERIYQIDSGLAAKVLQRFRSPDVFGLCGDYSRSVTDNPSTRTEIAFSSRRKTIDDYAFSSPAWFRQLQMEFEESLLTHSMRHGDPISEPLIHLQEEYLPKPGLNELMRAAASGNLGKLQQLIAAGALLDETDASGWTALMYAAAAHNNGGTFDELIHAGADPGHRSPYGDTVLMAFALTGYFEKDLARKTALLNVQNRDGVTALMLLAAGGRTEEIRAALRAGADAKLKDKHGQTALDYLDAIPCGKSLVRGSKTFWTTTGPCPTIDKDLLKARRLLLSAVRKR